MNLEKFGVQELSTQEQNNIEGGYWQYIYEAATLIAGFMSLYEGNSKCACYRLDYSIGPAYSVNLRGQVA